MQVWEPESFRDNWKTSFISYRNGLTSLKIEQKCNCASSWITVSFEFTVSLRLWCEGCQWKRIGSWSSWRGTSVWVQMKLTTWTLQSLHSPLACASSLPFCVWEERTSPWTGALKGNTQDLPNHFHHQLKSQHFPERQDFREIACTPKEFWDFISHIFKQIYCDIVHMSYNSSTWSI